jgi:ferredoxin--NADP+ reductase
LETRLGYAVGEITPARATVFICGLQGTIGQTITRLIPRGFIPDNKKIRAALEVPEDRPAALFFEQYDTTPVVDLNDAQLVATLKEQLHGAMPAG